MNAATIMRPRGGGRRHELLVPNHIARERGALPVIAGGAIESERVIGFAKEAVYGTFATPTVFVPGHSTFTGNQKVTRPPQSRGTRSQVVDVITGYELDFTVMGELLPDVWSRLLAGAMGSGSDNYSSAGGAATHSLTPQPQLPSYSFEEDSDVIPGEQTLARQAVGCLVNQWQLKATNQAIVTAQASLIGQKEITPATPGTPSNSNPTFFNTVEPADYSLLSATYKGQNSTQLLDITLMLDNQVQRVFSSNGKLTVARLVPTLRNVTLTTLLDFLDTNFYTDWAAGTKTSGFVFTITWASNIPATAIPYSCSFTIPGARPSGQYALQSASDVIQQNLTWSVTLAGTNEFSSIWINDEAGALA